MNNELQFIIYKTQDEDGKVNPIIKDDTLWLSQKGMSELFDCSKDNISLHLKNIFNEEELIIDAVTEVFSVTATDGKNYRVKHYNLDAIISVGYRINSRKATQFRIWATQILKEYIKKGFAVDDERLKQGTSAFGADYYKELLERIRSIRASERRIWLQITDIFAEYMQIRHPEVKGFSSQNIWRMKQFYESYQGNTILSPLVRELTWSNNLIIMSAAKLTRRGNSTYVKPLKKTNFIIDCPITNTNNAFPLHVSLDKRTKTNGVVLCEQVKSLDISKRNHKFVEKVPKDILQNVIDIVFSEIE
ncbi:MAG: RhuM family protein [Anaerovoracaceae bacterium]